MTGHVPSQVPVYPVVRLELRQDCDEWVAVLNGDMVGRCGDEEGKDAARALLVAAATIVAAQRPGGAIRARLGAGFEPDVAAVVTAEGRLIVQEDTEPPVRRRGPRKVLLLSAVAVVTAAVTATGVVVHSSHPFTRAPGVAAASPAPAPVPVQLPVLAPVGWSSVASWSLTLPPQSTGSAVSTDSRTVFAPGRGGDAVVGVNADSGVLRWSTSVGSAVVGGPVLVRPDNDVPVVVVWTSDHLVALDPASGAKRGSWELAGTSGQVTVVGGGVVVTGQSQHAQVFDGSQLVSRVVPAGGSVVGVHAGGLIVAGAGLAWLVTSSSVAGEGTPLSAPAGTTWAAPVGVVGGYVVCAFSAPDRSGVLLRAFQMGSWVPVWTTAALSDVEGFGSGLGGSLLVVSPDQRWGIVARTVVDFRTGAISALPSDWITATVGRTMGFGSTGGRVVSVTARGVIAGVPSSVLPTPVGTSVGPAAVMDSGEALIVATDGPARAVYAVRPRGTS